jgi:hypothetical protein
MTTVTIRITRSQLAAMDDNGCACYAIPNTWETYWAPWPTWQNDTCLATVHDFYKACELDREDCDQDGEDAEELLELDVTIDDDDDEDDEPYWM